MPPAPPLPVTVDPVVYGISPDARPRLLLHAGIVARSGRGRPRDARLIPGGGGEGAMIAELQMST